MSKLPQAPTFSHEAEIELLRERNSLLNIVSQYATALLSLTSTDQVLQYTTDHVVGKMGFNDCVIYLWDEGIQRLIQHSALGYKKADDGSLQNALSLQLGEGIVGRAAQHLKTVVVNDLSIDAGYIKDIQEAASELAIPIIHANELIGVLDSESQTKDFYTQDRINILTTVTAMLSAKLTQTKLIAQLEKSIVQLEYAEKLQKVLFNIAALSYESESIFNIYGKIHALIGELLWAKSFFVAIYNDENKSVEFPYIVDETMPGVIVEDELSDTKMEGMTAWIIKNLQALLLTKNDILKMQSQGDFVVLGHLPESWLGVPIHADDDLKGALVVQSYQTDVSFSEKDKELLTFVSRHVGSLLKRKNFEKKLQHQALHDGLTGLPNRTLLLNRISHTLKKNERKHHKHYAIMYMDVDFFKRVNDGYGHHVGDALLKAFATVLKQQARESDTVARLGGDEFAIFLEELDKEESAYFLAQRIIDALKTPLIALDASILTTTSIGIAVISDASISVDEGIRRADVAMYKAKTNGRGNYQVYDAKLDS
jgi:diguanylate cyclase (GGDEF)-like protein